MPFVRILPEPCSWQAGARHMCCFEQPLERGEDVDCMSGACWGSLSLARPCLYTSTAGD